MGNPQSILSPQRFQSNRVRQEPFGDIAGREDGACRVYRDPLSGLTVSQVTVIED